MTPDGMIAWNGFQRTDVRRARYFDMASYGVRSKRAAREEVQHALGA